MTAPILVAGGGLGGLAVALALGRKGKPVRVLEQTPSSAPSATASSSAPMSFRCSTGSASPTKCWRNRSCRAPASCSMRSPARNSPAFRAKRALRARFGHPYIVIHRVDLHQVLLDACRATDGIALEPSTSIVGFDQRGDSVVVATEDGREIEGAALIGADGLRSVVRARIVGDEPKPIGYVAHRTILPMDRVPAGVERDISALWIGPGFHLVHYPLRHSSLFNIVAVFRTGTFGEKGDAAFHAAEVERTYEAAHPTIKSLLAIMDLERRWVIADRDPVRQWSDGRVTLLGDAAHPALQTFAQGACMAIEDALCLAELVEQCGSDFAAAFRQYQAARCVAHRACRARRPFAVAGLSRRGHRPRRVACDFFQPRCKRHLRMSGLAL